MDYLNSFWNLIPVVENGNNKKKYELELFYGSKHPLNMVLPLVPYYAFQVQPKMKIIAHLRNPKQALRRYNKYKII